jgi:hypothetical protein
MTEVFERTAALALPKPPIDWPAEPARIVRRIVGWEARSWA